MANASPVNQTTTRPSRFEVTQHDRISYGPTLTLPTGQVPESVDATAYNDLTNADVSLTILDGDASIGSIAGNVCVATQVVHGFVYGTLYRLVLQVTAESGQVFGYTSYFDCVS